MGTLWEQGSSCAGSFGHAGKREKEAIVNYGRNKKKRVVRI